MSAIFLIILMISCKEATPKDYYSIKGKIKNFNGTIYLIKAVDNKYYFDNFIKDSAIVINGKFEFRLSNKINYPLPFYIETDKTRSFRFLLEPKDQQIIIDSLYYNFSPKIICKNSTVPAESLLLEKRDSIALEEFKTEFKKIQISNFPKDSIEKFAIKAREKLTFKTNLNLTEFARDYPNSFVPFWEIVLKTSYNGYYVELENAFNNLSDSIKQTKVSSIFIETLLTAKTLQNGSFFPEMKLKDKNLEEFVFRVNENLSVNYILVDFWFSYCSPCIAQFPKLNEFHSKYDSKQLKIISISTDKTKDIDNWYKVLEQKDINWFNLLDENGVESSNLGINTFPTNYLLNNNGIILRKDISLIELEQLLKNLK